MLASAGTALGRPVPATIVISSELKWGQCIATSFFFLFLSLLGMLTAPSVLGLAVAVFFLGHLFTGTVVRFRHGYRLLSDERLLDSAGRRYLGEKVKELIAAYRIPEEVAKEVDYCNSELLKIHAYRRDSITDGALNERVLRIGTAGDGAPLRRISRKTWSELLSAGTANHLSIYRLQSEVPLAATQQSIPMFVIHCGQARAAVGREAADPGGPLQALLDDCIEYGWPECDDTASELATLMLGGVSRLIERAIADGRAEDLRYGLMVTGDVLDELTDADEQGVQMSWPAWVVEIPEAAVRRIVNSPQYDVLQAVIVARFCRQHLSRWLTIGLRHETRRQYARFLCQLLIRGAKEGWDSAESIALRLRDLPFISRSQSPSVLREVGRIFLLAAWSRGHRDDMQPDGRHAILAYAARMYMFALSPRDRDGQKRQALTEFLVLYLAMAMYVNDQDPQKRWYVDIKAALDVGKEPGLVECLLSKTGLVAMADQWSDITHLWEADLWEISQHPELQSKVLALPSYCIRASVLLWMVALPATAFGEVPPAEESQLAKGQFMSELGATDNDIPRWFRAIADELKLSKRNLPNRQTFQ
jgi:hypothetical protein